MVACTVHIDVELALAFVDGALAAERRVELEQRIDACARCREIVAEAARGAEVPEAPTDIDPRTPTVSERRARRRAPPLASAATLDPGDRVGRYIVERAIGAGGMGVVTLARDPELRRAVVIKLVKPGAFGDDNESRDELEARLQREAQAMAQLSHPNVVQIFDIGRHGDRVFLAMEYIAGQTLDAWLLERRRTADEIIAMFRQAAAGLGAAHRAGLVHRDFKPTNVLVNGDGVAKVTDFGLARGASSPQMTRPHKIPKVSGVHAVLTHVDAVVGTPAYMAPEQAAGRVDARSDQYALALVLLDALVGQSPTERSVTPASTQSLESGLDTAGVTSRVRAAIIRALSEDPASRFSTMDELIRELTPPRVRPRRWPIVAGLGLCLVAIAIWFATRRTEVPAPDECGSTAKQIWSSASRTKLVTAFGASSRPLESWTGTSVTAAVDRAVERLAGDEVASCEAPRRGTKPAVDSACLTRRLDALKRANATLAEADDPWPLVRAIDECSPSPPPAAAAKIRDELRGADLTRKRAIELAEEASKKLGDGRLAAYAYERAANLALAELDMVAAEQALRAQFEAGERATDDAARGRALLGLLEVARWNGDAGAAARDANALGAIHTRQTSFERDELLIAKQEAKTFTEVGDVVRADAAWARMLAAAGTLDLIDVQLDAQVGQMLLRHQRFDPDAAKDLAAILDKTLATPTARARALVAQGDLALAMGDSVVARTAFLEASSLDPVRAKSVEHRIRIAHTRSVDGAVAELDAIRATADETMAMRAALAKARVLRAAKRPREALDVLLEMSYAVRPRAPTKAKLSALDKVDIVVERCDADIDLGKSAGCDVELVKSFHSTSPQRARIYLTRLRDARVHDLAFAIATELDSAVEVLVAIEAPPLVIAGLQWDIAREETVIELAKRRALADAARVVFDAAKRTGEVAAIDQWLAAPPSDPLPPEETLDAGGGWTP